MKIEYHIEKLEDMYFDVFFTFKTRELDSKINFALIDNNIESFIEFVNKLHSKLRNLENIIYEIVTILDQDDRIEIKCVNDTITITYNFVNFHFKNIAQILAIFVEISTYLNKNLMDNSL